MMITKTNLAIALVMLAVLTGKQVLAQGYDGDDGYGESSEYGGEGSYGEGSYGEGSYGEGSHGGYGGYGGWHGQKWNDVEMFMIMKQKLTQAAINAIGFSQLAALNQFNYEAMDFPYNFPGKLSLYVRDLEKVPPYYKYDYLYKKTPRSDDDDMH